MHAGTGHPKSRHMVGHPSEMAAEVLAAALHSKRPRRPRVMLGCGFSFSQEGCQQYYRGPEKDKGDKTMRRTFFYINLLITLHQSKAKAN